jgi:V/A-type H+/Na+-transporting ATPase subunit I
MSLVTSNTPIINKMFILPALIISTISALLIIMFSARDQKSLVWRLFIGLLRLFILNGFFSYLADVLSYIRLMALGMVTSGIAMAINNIAIIVSDIHFLGMGLAVVVLILGHLFNIAISLLSGFVHTLRLQYVEFFSKFFIAGGKPFIAFSESEKFVKFIEE